MAQGPNAKRGVADFDDRGVHGGLSLLVPGFLWLSAVIRSFWVAG